LNEVERLHKRRYDKLIEAAEERTAVKRLNRVPWKCRNCGRVMEAKEPPSICSTCDHPQAACELLAENH
jgi:rubrerythrin